MKTATKKLYEAMFLVDSAQAASDWEGVNKAIRTILERAGAEIVSMRKWDERKLTYEIQRHSRGTYILCYFRAGGEKIRDIERDVQLSERIVRVLILSAEAMSQADIEKETPLMQAEKQKKKAAAAADESEQAEESNKTERAEDSPETALLEAEDAEELFDASALAGEGTFEAVLTKTEQSESEETDELESASDETEPDAKEAGAKTDS